MSLRVPSRVPVTDPSPTLLRYGDYCNGTVTGVSIAPTHPAELILKNPVMTASGTSGFGDDLSRFFDLTKLGAIVTKTVTPHWREGNPTPRSVETPSGMLNSMGLPNPGIEGLLTGEGRAWESLGMPVIVSVAGGSASEFRDLAVALEGYPGVSAIEANFSCPNVGDGMEFATDPGLLTLATRAILEATSLPLIVKLSPNVTDIRPLAVAAQQAGAHALTIMNTILGMKIDVHNRRPFIGATFAGLSGPAVRPVGVRLVYQAWPEVDIPIIGAGGIASADDALEYILAGASAVQVGTASFVRPTAALEVVDGIEAYLRNSGVGSIDRLVGLAHPEPA